MGADVLTVCHREVDVDVHVPSGGVVNGEPRDTLQVGDRLYVHGRCPATKKKILLSKKKFVMCIYLF